MVAALGCAGPADSAVQEVVTMAQQTTYFATNLKALYLLLPLGRYNPQGGS